MKTDTGLARVMARSAVTQEKMNVASASATKSSSLGTLLYATLQHRRRVVLAHRIGAKTITNYYNLHQECICYRVVVSLAEVSHEHVGKLEARAAEERAAVEASREGRESRRACAAIAALRASSRDSSEQRRIRCDSSWLEASVKRELSPSEKRALTSADAAGRELSAREQAVQAWIEPSFHTEC
ncbi:unnamed protein product [Trichogramma brassicae]|uniref:Uncharacterized protein n=1 Tax=Trichogramma brassicae TaxID=86971 RepID=A0A6H5IPA6_9HYME|nr:unnamed protein product [Trichogramma brassicae]